MFNPTVGWTPIEAKLEDMSLEGMGFKMYVLDYHHVGPKVNSDIYYGASQKETYRGSRFLI